MILVETRKCGTVTELFKSDDYLKIVRKMDILTEELEEKGIFLFKQEIKPILGRVYYFASIKNGWELSLALADGWVSDIHH